MVRRQNLQKVMVMKVMKKNEITRQQYQQEIQVLKNLSIPGIPELYDYGEDEEKLFIVEEFVSGSSLHSILMQSISQEQLINYSKQIATIICRLHNHGFLYLDLKQEHIMVEQEQVYLLDYGLAQYVEHDMAEGIVYGTIPYVAPEQLNQHYATRSSDVYSLGIIFNEMITATRRCNKEVKSKYIAMTKRMTVQQPDQRKIPLKEILSILSELEEEKIEGIRSHPRTKIAVVGSQHRVGTTFFSIYLTSCLNAANQDACYYESEANRWILGSTWSKKEDLKVLPRMRGKLKVIPNYGPFVDKEDINTLLYKKRMSKIGIYDLGVISEDMNLEEYDFVFLMLGARPWEQMQSLEAVKMLPVNKYRRLFCSLVSKNEASQLARVLEEGVYRIGVVEDIYKPKKQDSRLLVSTLKREKNKKQEGEGLQNCP